ncbi:MAG: TRAP transporter fused permease subunit [Rhodobacteraceae bacterium]|nr:TRAP transporter fused permease subunit [Paracoccaceae bacterium]
MTDTNTHSDPEEGHAGQHAPVANALAALMTLTAVLYAIDLPQRLGFAPFTEQYVAVILSFVLPLVYLANPRFHGPLVWLDRLAAFIGFAACWYVAIRYPVFVYELVYKPVDGLIVAALLVVLMVEAVRRVTGLGLTIIIVAFILYALVGHLLPFGVSRQILPDRLFIYLAMDTNAMIGLPLMVASTVVFAFIFMGTILARCGGGAFFNDLALALVGRTRGGSAKIAVVSSFLFGSVSGSAVANVVASGVVTIPLMKRAGYKAHMAAATEALASTGGQLAPPIMGAAAFLMAEFLEIPYMTVASAALLPAALYYLAVFTQVDLIAARDKIAPVENDTLTTRQVLKEGWHFVVPFAVLLAALFVWRMDPEQSALLASVAIVAVGFLRGYRGDRLTLRTLGKVFVDTGNSMISLILVVAAAGFVIGILNITGLGFALTLVLVDSVGSNIVLLLLVSAVICIVLGMGMPTSGVYVLLAALVAPSLVEAGITPIAAHMFILYFGMMSMITPPVALASFAAATITKDDPLGTGVASMRVGWAAFILPFLFVATPALLMDGTWVQIAVNLALSALAIVAITAGIVGYWAGPLSTVLRLLVGVLGFFALPLGFLPAGDTIHFIAAGLTIALAVFLSLRGRSRHEFTKGGYHS